MKNYMLISLLTLALLPVGANPMQAGAQEARTSQAALGSPIINPIPKWQNKGCFASWCQTGWYASPAVADLNGDGKA